MPHHDVNMSCTCFSSLGLEECPIRMEMQICAFCHNKCQWVCFTSCHWMCRKQPLSSVSHQLSSSRSGNILSIRYINKKAKPKPHWKKKNQQTSIQYCMLSLLSVIFPTENYVLTCYSFLKIRLYWLPVEIKALQ